jgi:hypothetical protein
MTTHQQSPPGCQGFGFIDCPEAKEYFGRDVYVNKVSRWLLLMMCRLLPLLVVAVACFSENVASE